MVAGLLGNESSDSNRFTLVTPKSENDVRLQATLGNRNPTGLPVGVVSSLIENGEAFIKRNAKMMWRKTANSREEMPDYVERSYHEALVNAIAHRDYLIYSSEVHIDIYDDRMEIYSPGGMPDGSIIQDRDPLTVPSTRRNPVLADIFNRLGYMERKGSGFAKIIDNYAFQINYKEDKKPYFRSDRYQYAVIMPNLNYSDK